MAAGGAAGRWWRLAVHRAHPWLDLSLGMLFVLPEVTGSALAFYLGTDEARHPAAREGAWAPGPGWTSPVRDRALASAEARGFDPAGNSSFTVTNLGGAMPARNTRPSRMADTLRRAGWPGSRQTADGRRILRVDRGVAI